MFSVSFPKTERQLAGKKFIFSLLTLQNRILSIISEDIEIPKLDNDRRKERTGRALQFGRM